MVWKLMMHRIGSVNHCCIHDLSRLFSIKKAHLNYRYTMLILITTGICIKKFLKNSPQKIKKI